MSEWVSVEDRLPINEVAAFDRYSAVDVIVTDGVGVWAESFSAGRMRKFWGCFESGDITHWMPLPEPPKEQSE